MNRDEIKSTAFRNDDALYNKNIVPTAVPEQQIGIDLHNSVIENIIGSVETSQFDANALNSFTTVSRSRNELYETLDYMTEDSTLSSVLETYAEDATETNDQGQIMWVESADSGAAKFITYLLDALNVDKNIYKWVHSLCKYGDVYLRLYRESDYEETIFDKVEKSKDKKAKVDIDEDDTLEESKSLTEDLKIRYYSKKDKYVHYLEMADNPAQVFELTRFGKTAAYIKTDVQANNQATNNLNATSFLNRYSFNASDVELFPPTEWVHGSLEDNSSRVPEEVQLFVDDEDNAINYKVKRGQSLFYNTYKVWRQLMLLENSVLLNRVTQSSIVRVIGVEVGDMPKESVQPHLMNIKNLIEQKAALDVGKSISEYTNPGPVINNIYIPTRNGQGNLTPSQIGGEVKIGELDDLKYYQDKMFGNLRVPKQYFGVVDDAAGFSGGESLSIISSRYAKMIKRIQNTIIQTITDAINLILIDTGNTDYINNFQLRMQAPTTQEEKDRRENISSKVGLVSEVMNTLSDIESVPTKLKILKSLLSNSITDTEVIALIEEEIERLESEAAQMDMTESTPENDLGMNDMLPDFGGGSDFSDDSSMDFDLGDLGAGFDDVGEEDMGTEELPEIETTSDDQVLPSPEELDIGDMSDLTNPNLT